MFDMTKRLELEIKFCPIISKIRFIKIPKLEEEKSSTSCPLLPYPSPVAISAPAVLHEAFPGSKYAPSDGEPPTI
jgi:hypothetical protein